MQYRIVRTIDSMEGFEAKVNAALAEGWQLQGGVSLAAYESAGVNDAGEYTPSYSSTTWIYAQALVRETK